jgi:small subunit ribosomal protein S20
MPITTSAKKALRGSRRKRAVNLRQKKTITETVKKFKKLVAEKNTKEAKALLPQVQKALDKGAKRGIMKDNAASRKKSRLVKMIKNIS